MEIQMNKDLRFVFEALPSFGSRHAPLVIAYVCLFGVTPFHIKAAKLRRLLTEMKNLFDTQSFSFQKKTYPISHSGIAEGLDIVIKKHFDMPLDTHNYLKRVMVSISEREAGAHSRAQEAALKEKEEKLRQEARPSPEEAQENLKRLANLLSNIGGGEK